MVVTVEFVLNTLKRTGFIYWQIVENKQVIAEYDSTRSGNIDDSQNQLQEALDGMEGYTDIVLSKKTKDEKSQGGYLKDDLKFRVKCGVKGVSGNGNQTGGIKELQTILERNNQLEQELLKRDFNDRYSALEKRLKELEEDDEDDEAVTGFNLDGIERILNHPAVSKILGITAGPKQLSGIDDDENTVTRSALHGATLEQVQDQKHKCAEAAGRLLRIDGAAGDHLLQLAALAETKPDMYKMALGMMQQNLQ